ncbi:AbiV family abortive infection protein [Mesorhizobium sp. 8]|uniref:AbiV family abortive infection protein n=1 Tax=Mesorhizobium sp. 8 TaxID=2584466 RepID=UPI00112020EF|nr:AbiV family abortive infection protein [Mesorhizobium sp. 8]QDB99531.1 AbiV family abortive infection protein [Mesorhizobium sp. 8]
MSDLSIVANKSFQLAEDARLLFDNGRFETSLSLSILSIEEAGKYLLLSKGQSIPVSEMRKHPKKQQRAALSLLVRQMIAATEAVKKITRPEQWLDPAFEPTTDDFEKVWRILSLTGVLDFHRDANNGEMDRLKQAGFYIDVGHERLGPDQFRELAAKWLSVACCRFFGHEVKLT